MKKISFLTILFLLTVLAFGLNINRVSADTNYNLRVNGQIFTSSNTTINCGNGTATYNPSTNTLTLNNATIHNYSTNDDNSLAIAIFYNGYSDLNIQLVGDNYIETSTNSKYFSAISVSNGSLNLTGSGSLKIDSSAWGSSPSFYMGIEADGNIMINGPTINIDMPVDDCNYTNGIYTPSNITIKGNSKLDIYAEYALFSGDEDYYGTISIYSGDIVLHGEEDGVYGDLDLSNFSGKIMAGFYIDGTNSDRFTKDEVTILQERFYINYWRFGNFATYTVTNDSYPVDYLLDTPEEAFVGENISVEGGFNDNGSVHVYSLSSAKIYNQYYRDDTSAVGYNSSSKTFTMPDYPIIIEAIFKKDFKKVPSTFKANLSSYNKVNLSWTNLGCEGYYLYYKKSTDKNYISLGKTTKTSYSKSLPAGTKYDFKIIPYALVNDEIVISDSSKTVSIYTLKQVNAPKLKKKGSSKVKVTITKINGASGYEIWSSAKKKKGYKLVKTTTGTKATVKAKKKKTNYYKIRAYKVENGKKIYAPYSKIKSIKL